MMRPQVHSAALLVTSAVPAFTVVWSIDPITPLLVGIWSTFLIVIFLRGDIPPLSTTALNAVVIGTVAVVGASFLYAAPRGYVLFSWQWITVTEGAFAVAMSTLLRILAITVPALFVTRSISVHQVMATMAVRKILPTRVALATLISLRLIPVISNDVSETVQAQRARGRAMPFLAVARVSLVIAIRRAIRMSDTAEVRGFSRPDRLWRSYYPFRIRDWVLIALAIAGGIGSIWATVALGMWNYAVG